MMALDKPNASVIATRVSSSPSEVINRFSAAQYQTENDNSSVKVFCGLHSYSSLFSLRRSKTNVCLARYIDYNRLKNINYSNRFE